MKLRLVIAVLVLAVTAGALYWSEHRKPAPESTPSAAAPTILKLDPASITKLTIKPRDAAPVTLDKSGNNWELMQPKSLPAGQEAVSILLSTFSSLNSERVVEDRAANLEQYGLARPALEVDVTGSGNKTQDLLFGDTTPTGGTVYAMVKGDSRVFITSGGNKTSLDKGVNDLRDKRLLTVNFDKLRSIDLLQNSRAIEFERSGENWRVSQPKPLRTDQVEVNELVYQLRNVKMDLTGSGSGNQAAAYVHTAPLTTVKVTDNETAQTLQVRKHKDDYYATSSAVQGTYKVDAALGPALNKNLDDFRNKKLFDFGLNDPNKVELHTAKADYTFTRSGQDWWSNGKKVDPGAIESLVSTLQDLTATKFAISGFSAPEITLTVTSQDGKKVEQVLIAKTDKGYIAKRADGPDLFELDPSVVEGLGEGASTIKPIAEASKPKRIAGNPEK